MKPARVSILMTSYNRERYLGAAIDSVLSQSFPDLELLVVDDVSSDRSVEVARSYQRRDSRVRVHVNEDNLGQFGNRNRAASLARAPFLKFHDSDDVMYPYCVATLLDLLQSEARAGFALSAGAAWAGGPCPMLSTPPMSYRREFLGPGMFHCGPSGALFRTEVFRDLGGFEDRGIASDYLFWLRACRTVSVLLAPGDLFWYRIHPGQELQHPAAAASYARANAEAWHALFAPNCPLEGDELRQARQNWAWMLLKFTRRDLCSGRLDLAWLRLSHSGLSWRDWMRYVRRPRRDVQAGSPLDPQGEFVIPGWPSSREPTSAAPRPQHSEQ